MAGMKKGKGKGTTGASKGTSRNTCSGTRQTVPQDNAANVSSSHTTSDYASSCNPPRTRTPSQPPVPCTVVDHLEPPPRQSWCNQGTWKPEEQDFSRGCQSSRGWQSSTTRQSLSSRGRSHSCSAQLPLYDDEDNPFFFEPTGLDNSSTPSQLMPALHQPGSHSEDFKWDDTSSDSADENNPLATPTPCARTRSDNDKTPQASRHVPLPQARPSVQRLPAHSRHMVTDFTCTPQRTAGTGKAGRCDKCANDVHTLFTETEMEYICNICFELKSKSEFPEMFKVQTYETTSSITNMHNHLMLPTHIPIWIAHCDCLGIPIKALTVIKKVEAYRSEHSIEVPAVVATQAFEKFSIQGLTQLLMEVIIAEDLPITFVESEQVICLVLYMRQDLTKGQILGRTTMTKVIIETWHQKMYELAAEMKLTLGKISFTCDRWTDLNLFPFITITTHWIKEVVIMEKTKCGVQTRTLLEFRSDVIAFHEVPVSHTGAHLGEAFLYLVNWLGLLKKIGWITCDNATNNDAMFERLEYRLEGMGIDFHYTHNHIRCFAHIIHFAITAILYYMDKEDLAAIFAAKDGGTLPSTHEPGVLTRMRGMVQECRASSQQQIAFDKLIRAAQDGCQLVLVKDISNCWSSSHHMLHRALELRPQLEDFRLDQVHGADIGPYILHKYEWEAIKVELQGIYPEFSSIIQHGINKLEDYLNQVKDVPAYFLSMLVHPNIKMDWIEQNTPFMTNPPQQPNANAMDDKWAWDILQLGQRQQNFGEGTIEAEAATYLYKDTTLASDDKDGLVKYWEANHEKYPTIFALAVDLLPIQGTSVPCKRLFSSSRHTKTDLRTQLGNELMEATQIVKNSIKH
uniref:HAT C-terminal dimerisation domain-containing protein n=1 Tax=Moniliophthora roreri TaxID=221103 RepID=A0A0W0FNK7_MONRR